MLQMIGPGILVAATGVGAGVGSRPMAMIANGLSARSTRNAMVRRCMGVIEGVSRPAGGRVSALRLTVGE